MLANWKAGGQSLAGRGGAAQRTFSLDRDWIFGGKFDAALLHSGSGTPITLPHCVTPLSWKKWDPDSWENLWIYRRHFDIPPELRGLRLFLHFDRVMAGATPSVNGHSLPQHLGGFLPFEHEITNMVNGKNNMLSVAVDSRWLNAPPSGSPQGPSSVDYLLPGGINGSVRLDAVPSVFIRDVFAKPVNVLDSNRRLEVTCSIDAGTASPAPIRLVAQLLNSGRSVAGVLEERRC